MRRTTPEMVKSKIESRLDRTNGCWLWTGATDTGGYGLIRVSGSLMKTHRAYLIALGFDLDEQEVDHLCRVKACCNPEHLEPVSHRENVLRGIGPTAQNALKTHCIHGHEFTEENTYWRTNASGRDCLTCKTLRNIKCRSKG